MQFWKRLAVFITAGIASVACGAISKPTVAAIPSSINITVTITSTPSKTPNPTNTTNASTFEPRETIPLATLAAFSTLQAVFVQKPELGEYLYRCDIEYCGLSPDEKWAILSIWERGGGLSIVGIENKKQWNIYAGDMMDSAPEFTWNDSLEIVHWSKDGRYVYLVPHDGSEGGYAFFWRNHEQLIRVNLGNGTWVDTNMGSAFSFSPNERFLAFRRGQSLVIREFQTGNEQEFTVQTEYVSFGSFVWSPDSKKIIFIGSISNLDDEPRPNGFTLFLLNIDNLDVKIILEKDERYLYPQEWQTSNLVSLESLFKVDENGLLADIHEKYQLNLETNEITASDSP